MDGEGDDKAKFESNVTLVQVPQLVEQGRKNCKTDFLRVRIWKYWDFRFWIRLPSSFKLDWSSRQSLQIICLVYQTDFCEPFVRFWLISTLFLHFWSLFWTLVPAAVLMIPPLIICWLMPRCRRLFEFEYPVKMNFNQPPLPPPPPPPPLLHLSIKTSPCSKSWPTLPNFHQIFGPTIKVTVHQFGWRPILVLDWTRLNTLNLITVH